MSHREEEERAAVIRRVVGIVASLLIGLSISAGGVAAASFVSVSPRLTLLLWPEEIELHGTSTIGFTIVNPSAIPLTGVGFTTTIPSGLVIGTGAPESTPMCGGTVSLAGSLLKLAGASIQAGGDCHFAGLLRGNKAGTWTISTTRVTSLNGGTGNAASVTLTVVGPTQAPVGPGQTATPTPTPTATASPSESPTASPSLQTQSPDPSLAPLAPSAGSGGDSSTPWLAIILAALLAGVVGGFVAGGILLLAPRHRSRPA